MLVLKAEKRQPSKEVQSLILEAVKEAKALAQSMVSLRDKIFKIDQRLADEGFTNEQRREVYDTYFKPHFSKVHYLRSLPVDVKRSYNVRKNEWERKPDIEVPPEAIQQQPEEPKEKGQALEESKTYRLASIAPHTIRRFYGLFGIQTSAQFIVDEGTNEVKEVLLRYRNDVPFCFIGSRPSAT